MHWHERIGRRLKLRDLHTLLAVAQRGSMAKAATDLAITQPAISRAIAEMEHTLGARLFDRVSHGVEPTPYGRTLLKWGLAVFDDLRQAVNEINFLSDPTGGELRIGANEPIVAGLLPAIIDQLSRQHPRITFEVTQVNDTAQRYRELRERKFDLAIGRILDPAAHEDLHTEILFKEPLVVAAGKRNRWVRRRKIELADLINEPWSLPGHDAVIGPYISEAFRASGLDVPRITVLCASIQMQDELIRTGRFLTVYPRSLLRFSGNRQLMKVLPVDFPVQPPPVGIVRLKNRTISSVAQLFLDCARRIVVRNKLRQPSS